MQTRTVTITNESGFHIRPAQLFTEKAGSFQSDIRLKPQSMDMEVDGKSILGLMTLGLSKNDVITLTADGPDEEEAIRVLAELVESGFGE